MRWCWEGVWFPKKKLSIEGVDKMATIGDRIRDERIRLGMTQAEFGALVGVQKAAQSRYESGRAPDGDYFAAIAAVGADVLYILTGTRTGSVPGMTRREEALLDNYRNTDERGRRIVEQTALVVAEQELGAISKMA